MSRHAMLAAFVVVSLSSCGGGQKAALWPAQQDANLQEIEALWAEIQRMEDGDWDGGGDSADAPSDWDGDEGDAAPAPDPDVVMSEAAAPQSMARSYKSAASRQIREERDAMCHQQGDTQEPRCADVCTLAGSICDNAERICHLADELGGDAWADERCAKAVKACERSDERCCECE